MAICDEMIRKGIHKKIVFAVQLKVTAVDEALLRKLKSAGCIQVEYGFESGSQKMLDLMEKGTKVEDNYRAAELTRKSGMRMLANLITGMPGETKEDFAETLRFLRRIRPDIAGLYKLILLPGSKLYKNYASQYNKAQDWDLSLVDDLTTNYTNMKNEQFIPAFKRATKEIAINNAVKYLFYHIKNNLFLTIWEVSSLIMNRVLRYMKRMRLRGQL